MNQKEILNIFFYYKCEADWCRGALVSVMGDQHAAQEILESVKMVRVSMVSRGSGLLYGLACGYDGLSTPAWSREALVSVWIGLWL